MKAEAGTPESPLRKGVPQKKKKKKNTFAIHKKMYYSNAMIKAEIKDKELAEYLDALPEDDMIHFTMAEGRVRGAVFAGTHFVNTMRAQHGTGILETYILGQASLCGALLIPALMKGREHLSWRYDVEGSVAKGFNVESDSTGWVRSYLFEEHIPLEKPLESWDLKPFLGGEGFMTIQTVRPGDKFPQTSSVNTTGNIADDLVFYFDRSEQLKSALSTSIQMDKSGRVVGAGGIFIQVMPKTGGHTSDGKENLGSQINTSSDNDEDEILISSLEKSFDQSPSLGTWFSRGRSAEELVNELYSELNPVIALHRSVVYDCPCTKETFVKHLKALPSDEIKDIKEKGERLTLTCRNCGSVYTVAPDEI